MKQLLFAITFLFISDLATQPVLRNIENFTKGNRTYYLMVSPDNINPGDAGKNVVWDFSAKRNVLDTMYQDIVELSACPEGKSFPKANIAEKNSDGNWAFIEMRDSINLLWGFATGKDMIIKYESPYVFVKRPFSYGDSLLDSALRSYDSYGDSYIGRGRTLTVADGWGTLKLFGKTYNNVLRVRFEQEFTDSSQSTGNSMHIRSVSYAWFDTLNPAALLRIDQNYIKSPYFNTNDTTVKYMHKYTIHDSYKK